MTKKKQKYTDNPREGSANKLKESHLELKLDVKHKARSNKIHADIEHLELVN